MAGTLFVFGGIFFLVEFLGYTFIPSGFFATALSVLIATIAISLAIAGVRYRKEKTTVSGIISGFLPLLAIFFVMQLGSATDMYTHIYVTLVSAVLISSMILFFACTRNLIAKVILGILYSGAVILAFLLLFTMIIEPILPSIGHSEVVQAEESPNGVYLAEIIAHSQGALGGNTEVIITRQSSQDINLFIGELRPRPRGLYFGRWGEFERMTLRWETEERLYIYFENDTMIFSRSWGDRWIERQ